MATTDAATYVARGAPLLDEMRQLGDPPADAAIEYWRRTKGELALRSLAHQLVGFENVPDLDWLLDELAIEHFDHAMALDPRRCVPDCGFAADDPIAKQEVLDEGQQVFQDHGLKILLILFCYSLPAAYAAQKGVKVLHSEKGSTGYLVTDLNRRLLETTQFVIEVFADNGLMIDTTKGCGLQGPAIKTALRVRLLHAAVRGMIETNRAKDGVTLTWDAKDLGKPVNQEDMAGTLMTFSWVVLDGLRKMSVGLTPAQERGYYHIWQRIGRLLGVEMIPPTVEEAEKLTMEIRHRQIDEPVGKGIENKMGADMTTSLLQFVRERFPWPLSLLPLPEALLLFFMPRTEEVDVAVSLGVRRTRVRAALVASIGMWFRLEAWLTKFALFHAINRLMFVEWNQKDPRAFSLLQFSRNTGRRLLRGMVTSNRNQHLDIQERTGFTLHGWEHKWGLDQTANPVKRATRAYARSQGQYEIKV